MNYDVVIIGAGVTGCAVARELAKTSLHVCVLEKEEDVCCGTSKANSAIVHAGYDAVPGTWKARMNRLGNEKMEPLAKELDFPFVRTGSLVVCRKSDDPQKLKDLYERGWENGIPQLELIWDVQRLRVMEPNLAEDVTGALYAPTAGIVCPFLLTVAMAENACTNGVDFYFHTEVQQVSRNAEGYLLQTMHDGRQEMLQAACVVDAAGTYADIFHNMVSTQKLHITARKGEYCLLDKGAGDHVRHTIFVLPDAYGKGVLVTPTVHGNLLLGPTAVDCEDRGATNTTGEGLSSVLTKAFRGVKDIPVRQVITSFAGLRAHEDGDDFVIGEAPGAPGFIDCCGIESPGLTAAPAIGEYVAGLVQNLLHPAMNPHFQAHRKGILRPADLPLEKRNALIRQNPAYGRMVCRCESITEGEILDAISRPLGARSLDGVKRRVRAGMGRCQGGFCSPKVMDLLQKATGRKMTEITKSGGHSAIVIGRTRQGKGADSHEKM